MHSQMHATLVLLVVIEQFGALRNILSKFGVRIHREIRTVVGLVGRSATSVVPYSG